MITNVSLVTVYVTDQDEAKKFYTDILGFEARTDATLGDYRWVTVGHPDHRELEITLMVPGPPLDDEMAEVVRRALARGRMGGLGLRVDDCQKTYEDLTAKGVEFPQPPVGPAVRRGGRHARQQRQLARTGRAQVRRLARQPPPYWVCVVPGGCDFCRTGYRPQ